MRREHFKHNTTVVAQFANIYCWIFSDKNEYNEIEFVKAVASAFVLIRYMCCVRLPLLCFLPHLAIILFMLTRSPTPPTYRRRGFDTGRTHNKTTASPLSIPMNFPFAARGICCTKFTKCMKYKFYYVSTLNHFDKIFLAASRHDAHRSVSLGGCVALKIRLTCVVCSMRPRIPRSNVVVFADVFNTPEKKNISFFPSVPLR